MSPISISPSSHRPWWTAAALITCLGAFFCLHDIGSKSLWGDEINMVQFVTGERAVQKSSGNALGYLELLRWVRKIGRSDTMHRLPAAGFGILSLPLVMWVFSQLFSPRIGLATGLLLAVSPTFVAHAQQVHSYSAFCGLACGSLGIVWLAHHRRNRSLWLSWAVLLGVGMWLHLYTIFVFVAQLAILAALVISDRRWRWPTGREICTAGLLVVPPVLISFPLIRDWIAPLGLEFLAKVLGREVTGGHLMTPAFALGDLRVYRQAFFELTIWRAPFFKLHNLIIGLALLGLIVGWRRHRRATLAGLLWILVPLPLIAFFSYKSGIDFGSRRLIFILPMVLAFTAIGLDGLAIGVRRWLVERWNRPVPVYVLTAAFCGVLAFLVSATALHHYFVEQENPDRRSIARLLELAQRPGDRITAVTPRLLNYYYRGTLPIEPILPTHRLERDILSDPETRRVWYVRPRYGARHFDPLQPIERSFEERDAQVLSFAGLLIVSVLEVTPEARNQRRQIAELMVALKPERSYAHQALHRALSDLDVDAATRRRVVSRVRRSTYHPLIPWLR